MNPPPVDAFITQELAGACARLGIATVRPLVEIAPPEHGDLTCNVALAAAKQANRKPRELAESLAAEFPTSDELVCEVGVADPGFLNFRLGRGYLQKVLASAIDAPADFGKLETGGGESWLFEYVSANPTGPVNIVSARAASVGDSLVRIFRHLGCPAASEYYVNDGGGQVENLGGSVQARLAELEGNAAAAAIPEGGYHGAYVIELSREWRAQHPQANPPDDAALGRWAADRIRIQQEASLARFRVRFDRWFRESELYQNGLVDAAHSEMVRRDVTFAKDGAVYFRASAFGDSQDRVLKTSDGRFTYVVPDIAYHLDKQRRGFQRAVTILGPDHHGHIAQMKAALKAVGLPDGFYIPLLIQQVNLRRGAEEIKMSKRAGVGVTMDELVAEVGVDAARFFFLMRRTSSHLDFDVELAKRHSEDNPVYYVQYAHARIRSIFRQPGAFEPNSDAELHRLTEPEELWLMRMLARFPWTLSAVRRGLEPHPMTVYLGELAHAFHLFYQRHRVIGEEQELTAARLMLCRGVENTLGLGLQLIGVDAPDRM